MKFLLVLMMGWIMANPYFKLALRSICYDNSGTAITIQDAYILEWLRRNFARNGSFEDWDGTYPDHWSDSYGIVKSLGAQHGTNCIKTDGVATSAWANGIIFPLNPALEYHLSCYVMAVSAVSSGQFSVGLYYYDSDMNAIGGPVLTGPDLTTSWTQYTRTFTPSEYTAGTAYAKITFNWNTPGNLKFLDSVRLTSYNPHDLEEYSDFSLLNSGDYETFTFNNGALLVGTMFHAQDDPVIYQRSESGVFRAEIARYPLRNVTLRARLTSIEAMRQLRRFHAKVRGIPFTYVDSDGVETSVIWPGGFPDPGAGRNSDVYVVDIPLTYETITEGA